MPIDYPVVSCEHGGNRIPEPFLHFFRTEDDRALLESHRGYDAGALAMAEDLATRFAAPLITATISRLLVDLNRSLGNPNVYSPIIRQAPETVRRRIVENYYRPYRIKAEELMQSGIDHGCRIVHISCHSFTPELAGKVRNADIGLLYDPARKAESAFCKRWQASLNSSVPELKVRRNYPYAGKNDGFTTYLRRCFSPDDYLGIELEINQKHVFASSRDWTMLRATLAESLRAVLSVGR